MQEFDYDQIAADERRQDNKKHGPKGQRRPKARADGEGSIFILPVTRSDGRVVHYFRATRTVDLGYKRKKYSANGKTELEALARREQKIAKALVEAGQKQPEDLPLDSKRLRLTVADCLRDWMEEKERQDLAPATIRMYSARIRNHLLPAFGDRTVHSLQHDELKHFFGRTLPAKGLGPDSIRQTFICLKSALEFYHNSGAMIRRPMGSLKTPAKKSKDDDKTRLMRQAAHFLSSYLLEAAQTKGTEARWFMGLMGLRQGEALGMTDSSLVGWESDLDGGKGGGRIRIHQQLQHISPAHGCGYDTRGNYACGKKKSTSCPKRIGDPYWELRAPKTVSGKREIIVGREAWDMLLAHRRAQRKRRKLESFNPAPGEGLDKLLFTREDGSPIWAQRDRRELQELVGTIQNAKGIKSTHDLRRLATTMLVTQGAGQDELGSAMGWSAPNTAAQIATYSSADLAALAAPTMVNHAANLYANGRKPKTPESADGQVVGDDDDAA